MAPKRKNTKEAQIKEKGKIKKTHRVTSQSQNSFISTTTRERKVTNPNGQIISDIFTYSQETQVTTAQIKEDIDEFSRVKIVPAFLGLTSIGNSAIIKMFHNRFDMAFAQNKLMKYHSGTSISNLYLPNYERTQSGKKKLLLQDKSNSMTCSASSSSSYSLVCLPNQTINQDISNIPAGPGFYMISNNGIRSLKLNYPIFRGLNTFQSDFKLHHDITRPILKDVLYPGCDNTCLKFSEWIHFYDLHMKTFSKFDSIWQRVFLQPLTVDELLRMTLCRYVARMRNIQMPLVDEEEICQPYPILSIDIDCSKESHTDNTTEMTERFGTAQEIISPLTAIPISGIHMSSSNQEKKEEEKTWSDTEFEVTVMYHLPDHIRMYKLNQILAVKYAKLKATERAGYDITTDIIKLQEEYKTKDLESCMYEPILSQGIVLSSILLDLPAIGAVTKYINWCKQKYNKTTSDSLLHFSNDGPDLRKSITMLEYGLIEARKRRFMSLQQEDDFQGKDRFITPKYMLEYHGFKDHLKE